MSSDFGSTIRNNSKEVVHLLFIAVLPQHRIQHHHNDEAGYEAEGGIALVALSVALRDEFIADHE